MTAEQHLDTMAKAEYFVKRVDVPRNQPPPDLPEEVITDEGLRAFIYLYNYEHYRQLSNFPHFLTQARIFSEPGTVDARRHFYLADRARTEGDRRRAIEEYKIA